jgi:hypothetical protein
MIIPGENIQNKNDEKHEKIHAEAHDRGRDVFPGLFNGKLPQTQGNAGYEGKNKPVHGVFLSFLSWKRNLGPGNLYGQFPHIPL